MPILRPLSIEPKEMQVFHNVGRKAMRAAASVIVLGLLGSLAGCGGGGGGGDSTTPPPDNIPTLQSIEITPSLTKAAAGTTAQFTATGVYTDNSTEDLTAQATWASSNAAVAMVSNAAGSKGVATTTGVGSATVSATSGDVSGDTMLTVTDATLVSIEVSPTDPTIANGLTQQFTATGLYSDNSTQDLTTQVTWASSNAAVATVSDAAGSNGLATAAGAGSTTVSATSGGVTGDTMLTVTDATLVAIEVSPTDPSIAHGTTQEFTATGVYTDDSTHDLTAEVTWASSNEAVATVSNDAGSKGLAMAAGAGSTTVSATSGGVTGDTTLTVTDATLVSIEVSPTDASIVDGTTQEFTATGVYTDASTQDLTTEVTWASSDDEVATVSNADDSNGLATGVGVGSTTVSATSGDVTGDTTLTVTDATLVSIEVTPADPSIADGTTQEFTATGVYTDASTQDLTTEVTWSSSDDEVATVSNADDSKGLATAVGLGTATVSATSGDVTGDTTLTVTDATLVSIEVTPADPSIADGTTQEFTATGVYTDASTQDLTTEVTWSSSDDEIATVSNADDSKGLATAVGLGAATVSATSGGVTGDTTLTVTDATLVSIEVSPADASIADGTTQEFAATGLYTDGSTQDLTTEVTWDSSDDEIATVSNADDSKGLATAAGVGVVTVSATSGGVTGVTTLTVSDATLVSIAVTPADASIADGTTQEFTATGLYTDGSTQDLTTEVTWSSFNEAVATVSNADDSKGLATAAGAGTTTVSAISGGVTGDTTLTVTATLVSIEVTPTAPSIANGLTQQFTATGLYSDGSTQDLTSEATWDSSDDAVATVSNSGLATAASVGSATVSATSGAVSGNATLTVTPAPLTVNQMVAALLTAVTGVGPGQSLKNKITLVQQYLAASNIVSACSMLDDFKTQVSGLTDPPVPVAQLTADANAIKAAIPCP